MSRVGITNEQVIEAANQIWSRAENPTIERVRRSLGDRGSNSTISKYLNDWRSQHRLNSTNTPTPINASNPLMSPPNDALNQIWQQIQSLAQAEIDKVRAESRIAIQEANQQQQTLLASLQQEREIIGKFEQWLKQLIAEIRCENK